jgi:hypothetical protein
MATTNDAMYEELKVLYPTLSTLGDMLYQYWVDNGLQYRGSLQYQFYGDELGKSGEAPSLLTWGDRANAFWSDADYQVYNLELETGSDLLLEDGGFVLLEAGNG